MVGKVLQMVGEVSPFAYEIQLTSGKKIVLRGDEIKVSKINPHQISWKNQ